MQAAGYQPQGATRATALSVIAAIHVAGLAALASLGGVHVVVQKAQPLLLSILPAPPSRPLEPPRPVPLPRMIVPQVRVPDPPAIDNLFMVRAEAAPPPPAAVTAAAPSPKLTPPAPPAPSPAAPTLTPPRADMAYLDNPAPRYPSASRRAGEQGRVLLRVRVTARGEVDAIEVQRSSGYARLDEAALTAVRRWKFAPATVGERAVDGWALVPVNFALSG